MGSTDIIMHHYRSREDEMSCGGGVGGGDPYFYLRLSAGAAPYNPIKLEVDVKPESCTTPVVCLEPQRQRSPPDAVVMDTTGCDGVVCKDEQGTTGIGLLALTQLDGYGGYKSAYCDPTGGEGVISSTGDLLHDRIGDDDDDHKPKYSYSRLIYSSPDDIKHQVFVPLFFEI